MQAEGCNDWKIDSKDPKICRNCRRPKAEHPARSTTFAYSLGKPSDLKKVEERPSPILHISKTLGSPKADKLGSPLKPIFDKDLKSPGLGSPKVDKLPSPKAENLPSPKAEKLGFPRAEKLGSPRADKLGSPRADKLGSPLKPSTSIVVDKEKDVKSAGVNPRPTAEKDVKSPKNVFPPVKVAEKEVKSAGFPLQKKDQKEEINEVKSPRILAFPTEKKPEKNPQNIEKSRPAERKEVKFRTEVISKPSKENKKEVSPNSSSESEEEAKKPAKPILKNQDFKNKLEGLIKLGGNPMRMNNDDCRTFVKKKSITPLTLVNGKRASKTFGFLYLYTPLAKAVKSEDIFDIDTKVQVDKDELKRNLNKLLQGKSMPPMGQKLTAIPETKGDKGKELREEMIKSMNQDILERPAAKKQKAKKQASTPLDLE